MRVEERAVGEGFAKEGPPTTRVVEQPGEREETETLSGFGKELPARAEVRGGSGVEVVFVCVRHNFVFSGHSSSSSGDISRATISFQRRHCSGH
jgi:hypothetical protein